MATINDSVQYLKGVGPAFAKKFEKLGIHTIRDLLLCYPRKYIDYTQPYTVVSAPYDTDCCVRATVLQKEPPRRITVRMARRGGYYDTFYSMHSHEAILAALLGQELLCLHGFLHRHQLGRVRHHDPHRDAAGLQYDRR